MSRIKVFLSVLAVVAATSACSINQEWFITHNGNMPTNDRIEQLKVGQSKDEVLRTLGSPSTVVSLDRNTWIYMSSDIKRVAFFAPEEIRRDVLTIKFGKNNTVEEFSRTGLEEGKEVEVAKEEKTETLGDNKGFFEKFFGGTQTYAPMGGGNSSGL